MHLNCSEMGNLVVLRVLEFDLRTLYLRIWIASQQLPGGAQEQWLPELKAHVASINETFSKSFSGIGCAGEVELFEHDDYDHFAVHIKCASGLLVAWALNLRALNNEA